MSGPQVEGYVVVSAPPSTLYVLPEWKEPLLESLRTDFADVPPERRSIHTGRIDHFSYLPNGAPGRVLVRRAVRAGLVSFLGDRHFGCRRFLTEIRATRKARNAGLDVPEIVAARLTRAGPMLHRFLLVVRQIENATDLLEASEALDLAGRRETARLIGRALAILHDAGVYHGDLSLKNILLTGTPGSRQVHFIDFDKARLEPERREALDEENLDRLYRSVEKWLVPLGRVTRTDKLRMLRAYTDDRNRWRRIWERLGSDFWIHRLWWSVTGHKPK